MLVGVHAFSPGSLWGWNWWGLLFLLGVLLVIRCFRLVDAVLRAGLSLVLKPWVLHRDVSAVVWRPSQGVLRLEGVALSSKAVAGLDLPFSCNSAEIGSVEFRVTSWKLWNATVRLRVSGVALSLFCRNFPQHISAGRYRELRDRAARSLKKQTLKAIDAALWAKSPTWRLKSLLLRLLRRHVLHRVIRGFSLLLEDIHIEIDCGRSTLDASHPDWGKPARYEGSVEHGGRFCSLTLSVRSFSYADNTDSAHEAGVVSSNLALNGLNVDTKWWSDSGSTKKIFNLVRRWNVNTNVKWHIFSDVFSRSDSPNVLITVSPSALLLNASGDSLQCLSALAAQIMTFFQFYEFRRQRPQVSVAKQPSLWWKHAYRSVCLGIESLPGVKRTCTKVKTRRAYRKKYTELYGAVIKPKGWPKPFVFQKDRGLLCRELRALESKLSTIEIAEFRWWYWAGKYQQQNPGCSYEELSLNLRTKLLEVENVMASGASVFDKDFRPKTIQLEMSCPKVGVSLTIGHAFDEPRILQASATALEFKLIPTLVSSDELKYQTRSGPFTISARCMGLEVDQGATPKGSSTSPKPGGPSWLLQSPPIRTGSGQAFLDLKFMKHPLQSLKPRELALVIAPIDLAYIEDVVVRVTHFACRNIAALTKLDVLPKPGIMPQICEALAEPDDANAAFNNPLQRLQMQVNVGDVRLLLPCRGNGHPLPNPQKRRSMPMPRAKSWTSIGASNCSSSMCTPSLKSERHSHHTVLVCVLSGFNVNTNLQEELGHQGGVARVASPGVRARPGFGRKDKPGDQNGLFQTSSSLGQGRDSGGREVTSSNGAAISTNVSMEFSAHAFLADAGFIGVGSDFQKTLKVLESVKVVASLQSWLELTDDHVKHFIQVRLLTTTVHGYLSPFAWRELSVLSANLSRALTKCSTCRTTYGTRKRESDDDSKASMDAAPSLSLLVFLDLSVPDAMLCLVKAFSMDHCIADRSLILGSVELKSIEVSAFLNEMEKDFQFTLGSLAVSVEQSQNIKGTSGDGSRQSVASSSDSTKPFTIIRPVPENTASFLETKECTLHQAFRAWKATAGDNPAKWNKSKARRNGRDGKHNRNGADQQEGGNGRVENHVQFSGRIVSSQEEIAVQLSSSFLIVAIDNKVLDSCMDFFSEIMEASTKEASREPELGESTIYEEGVAAATRWSRLRGAVRMLELNEEVRKKRGNILIKRHPSGRAHTHSQDSPPLLPRIIYVDVSIDCFHTSLSVDRTPLGVAFGAEVQGALEAGHLSGRMRLLVDIADLSVVDKLCTDEGYRTLLDGGCTFADSSTSEACSMSLMVRRDRGNPFEPDLNLQDESAVASLSGSDDSASMNTIHLDANPQNKDPLNTLVRVKLSNIHAVCINRFVKDVTYFWEQISHTMNRIKKSDTETLDPMANPALTKDTTFAEILVDGFKIDIPRSSCSDDFFSITGEAARVILPASASFFNETLDAIGMSKSIHGIPLRDVTEKDWSDMQPHTSSAPQPPFRQVSFLWHETSLHASPFKLDPFALEPELGTVFSSVEGSKNRVGALLDGLSVYWGKRKGEGKGNTVRKVIDGDKALLDVNTETSKIKIWWPEYRCVFGESQCTLLMSILWGNLVEDGTFTEPVPRCIPIGAEPPNPAPSPESLGIEDGHETLWKVEVLTSKAQFMLEERDLLVAEAGGGAEVATMDFSRMVVVVEQYVCGSIRVRVISKEIGLDDVRHLKYGGSGAPLSVVSIQSQNQCSANHLLRIASTSTARWQELRESISRHSMNRASRKSLNPPSQTRQNPRFIDNFDKEVGHAGFVFDYVYHGIPPTSDPGPQVIEVILLGADVAWPYVSDLSFTNSLSSIFQTYFYADCCAPNPSPTLDPWVYFNVIVKDSRGIAAITRNKPGLSLSWSSLRMGYFWGGDGEVSLRIDFDNLQADSEGSQQQRPILEPLSGAVSTQWQSPKALEKWESVCMDVTINDLSLALASRHIPLIHTFIKSLSEEPSQMPTIPTSSTSDDAIEAGPRLLPPAFRPNITKYVVSAGSVRCMLLDDDGGHCVTVLEASLRKLEASIGWEDLSAEQPIVTLASCGAELHVDYMNNALESMESLVEPWVFSLEYRDSGTHRRITASSDARLNLLVTPASFICFGDAMDFYKRVSNIVDPCATHIPSPFVETRVQHEGLVYRLVNWSGMRLSYWADAADAQRHSQSLQPDEETVLCIQPCAKSVMLPSSHQQVRAKTICMQFEGNWNPIVDIIVDKVGKYAYELQSPLQTSIPPIIIDVTLEGRVKTVTVHSIYRIENQTSVNLDFRMHPFSVARVRSTGNVERVPRNGVLAPTAHCYLPLQASFGALLYLKSYGALGEFQRAKKDVIRVGVNENLECQQGMYTCPAINTQNESVEDFHCCLEVKSTPVKSLLNVEPDMDIMEHTLMFHPPINVKNLLPNTITVKICDAPYFSSNDFAELMIGPGAAVPVYQFDSNRYVRIKVEMDNFTTWQPIEVISPPKYFRAKHQSAVKKDIVLMADPAAPHLPGGHRLHGKSLKLKVHHCPIGESSARQVEIYSPYWVLNKTDIALELRDTKPASCAKVTSMPASQDSRSPVMYTSSKGNLRVGIDARHWSRNINIDSLGIKGTFSVVGPVDACSTAGVVCSSSISERSHQNWKCDLVVPHGGQPLSSEFHGRGESGRKEELDSISEDRHEDLAESDDFSPIDSGTLTESQPKHSRYDFNVAIRMAPGVFERTKVVTLTTRYLIINYSKHILEIGQRATDRAIHIHPNDSVPFHWYNADERQEVCIRPLAGKWLWSGSFRLDEVNDFGLKIREKRRHHNFRILPVDVSLTGDSMVCVINKERKDPPYRIENRCADITIRFRQRDVDMGFEMVGPGQSVEYAWEEPSLPHRLRVMIDAGNLGIRDMSVHEYGLDNIKAHPTIILGKRLKAVGAMVAMGRKVLDKFDQTSSPTQGSSDSDTARVYVRGLAEGGTRIIRFSDTTDDLVYTSEDTLTLLSKKMAWLEQSVSAVDKELVLFTEAAGMDLDMIREKKQVPIEAIHHFPLQRNPLRRTSGIGRHVRAKSLSRIRGAEMLEVGELAGNPDHEIHEIPEMNEIQEVSEYSESPKTPNRHVSDGTETGMPPKGSSIRNLLRKVTLPKARASADDAGIDFMEPSPTTSKLSLFNPLFKKTQDGQVKTLSTAPSSEASMQPAEKRQSVVFERVVSQFAESIKDSMSTTCSMDDLDQDLSVSGQSSAQTSPLIRTGVDESVGSPGIGAVSLRRRRSGLLVSGSDASHTPQLHRSLSREAVPLTDLTLKVVEQRRQRAKHSVMFGVKPGMEDLLEKDEILGGELVVNIVGAKGLLEADSPPPDGRTGLGARLARHSAGSSRGFMSLLTTDMEIFCVLKCEGQERRTVKVPVANTPRWDEEVTFRSVPVSSLLVLTVYGKNLIMNEVFLGEVVIPLREIEDMAQPGNEDVRAYTLSRRSVKEKVSGEVYLSIAWRVTPLDKMTLKVKALQEELDDREELMAILKARAAAGHSVDTALAQSGQLQDDSSPVLMHTARLEVKVIEARNLVMPHDKLRKFHTMDAYAVVTCERKAGWFSYQTHVEKNKQSPKWNAAFKFEDVGLTSFLTVQVFDKKNLRADDFLGQLVLPVSDLKDSKPHYIWSALQPRGPRDLRAGGDIHLRLKWSNDGMWDEEAGNSGLMVDINLNGIGISVVEASARELPRELMHILFDQLTVEYRRVGQEESARLVLKSMQIDNQLITSSHPVVFSHASFGSGSPSSANTQIAAPKPILEVRLEKLNQNPRMQHIRYFTVLLQEIDLVIQENFLDLLMRWYDELPLEDLWPSEQGPSEEDNVTLVDNLMRPESCLVENCEDTCKHSMGIRWYFEVLHIQPIKINITLLPTPGMQDSDASRRYQRATALGINLMDITNLPLKINAMILKNAFMRPSELMSQINRHMLLQVLYDVHKILGTAGLLGTPVNLGSSIITGVASFFYEPAKGIVHGPEEFARGLATGTMNLIKNSMSGVFSTVGQVTGGFGKTLAALSMDDQYYQRFSHRQKTNTEKIIEGARILGSGCVQGVTGVVMDPITGVEKEGMVGLAKGVATGFAGLITKPTSGLLGFASKTVSGIGGGIKNLGDETDRVQRTRVRAPRDFGISMGLVVAEAQLLRWKELISGLQDERFSDDSVVDFLRQDNTVLVLTDHRIIYVNFVKKAVRWVIDMDRLVSVSSTGLDVTIHYCSNSHFFSKKKAVQGAATRKRQKRIVCGTRDMQRSLLVKIEHQLKLLKASNKEGDMDAASQGDDEFEPEKRLSIMNSAPPTALSPLFTSRNSQSSRNPEDSEELQLDPTSSSQGFEAAADQIHSEEMQREGAQVPTSSHFPKDSQAKEVHQSSGDIHPLGSQAVTTENSNELDESMLRMGGSEPYTGTVNSSNTELSVLTNHIASMHTIAMSYGGPMSDRDVLDLISSIGQISLVCLSFPIMSSPELQSVSSLIGTINRLCFHSDRVDDTTLSTVRVLSEMAGSALSNLSDLEEV